MNEERYLILKMLEEGKISAEEATALLEALEESSGRAAEDGSGRDEGHDPTGERVRRWRHGPRLDLDELHRSIEKARREAMDFGDEVSRQVQDAMDIWREEWRRGGSRPFRHFTRNMGDVFQVPFGREKHEEVFDEEVDFGPEGFVRLASLSGEVVVHGWEESRVKVHAVKRVWARTADEARERSGDYRIRVQREGNELDIRAELADDAPGWLPARCTIDYEVWVPEACGVGVSLTNGDLNVSGIIGGVELRSTNGDIVARGLGGRLSVYSTNGDIQLLDTRAGELVVKTVNGDLDIDLAGLGAGDHDASTVHGDIGLRLPTDLTLDLRASTMHGDVDLAVPGRVAFRTSTRLRARLGPADTGPETETRSAAEAGDGSEGGSQGDHGVPALNVRAVFGDVVVKARRGE